MGPAPVSRATPHGVVPSASFADGQWTLFPCRYCCSVMGTSFTTKNSRAPGAQVKRPILIESNRLAFGSFESLPQ